MAMEAHRNRVRHLASGAKRHTQPVSSGIAWVDQAPTSCPGDLRAPPEGEISMRQALITTHLLNQARDAAIAQADADARLQHQAQAKARTEPAEPGRLARVVTLARRIRALVAQTT
jgi:hypothetical protein